MNAMNILTPAGREVSRMVAQGMANRAIAEQLGKTENAIKMRLRTVFDATGMSSRLELALWYRDRFPEEFAA